VTGHRLTTAPESIAFQLPVWLRKRWLKLLTILSLILVLVLHCRIIYSLF